MKFNSILLLTFVLLSALVLVSSQDDKGRANPLLRRAGPRTGAKTSTTTTAPSDDEAPAEEDYDQAEGEEEVAEKDAEEAEPAVVTEAPKKIGPIIRPFRSNDDLLNALKRRQMNVKPGVYKPLTKATPASSASSGDAEEDPEAPAKSSSGGAAGKKPSRFNVRSGRS